MAKDFLPQVGPARRAAGSVGVFLLIIPTLLGLIALFYFTAFNWIPALQGTVDELKAQLESEEKARVAAEKRLQTAERRLAGLSAASGVEVIYGGGTASLVPKNDVKIPYKRSGSVIIHDSKAKALYYFTAKGETIGQISSHPRTLGAWYLWPILRDENKLSGRETAVIPEGTLLRVPLRIGDWRMRQATTAAGAPNAVRSKVLKQAGIE